MAICLKVSLNTKFHRVFQPIRPKCFINFLHVLFDIKILFLQRNYTLHMLTTYLHNTCILDCTTLLQYIFIDVILIKINVQMQNFPEISMHICVYVCMYCVWVSNPKICNFHMTTEFTPFNWVKKIKKNLSYFYTSLLFMMAIW